MHRLTSKKYERGGGSGGEGREEEVDGEKGPSNLSGLAQLCTHSISVGPWTFIQTCCPPSELGYVYVVEASSRAISARFLGFFVTVLPACLPTGKAGERRGEERKRIGRLWSGTSCLVRGGVWFLLHQGWPRRRRGEAGGRAEIYRQSVQGRAG